MKVKVESEKVGLKLNIQKTKIMASGPITSWEIDGEIVETLSDFIFLGSKITADGCCSHEIKRRLLGHPRAPAPSILYPASDIDWHLLNSWPQSLSAVILEPPKIKSATVSTVSPSICQKVMGPDAMILVF